MRRRKLRLVPGSGFDELGPPPLTIFPKTTTALDAGIRGYRVSCTLAATFPMQPAPLAYFYLADL